MQLALWMTTGADSLGISRLAKCETTTTTHVLHGLHLSHTSCSSLRVVQGIPPGGFLLPTSQRHTKRRKALHLSCALRLGARVTGCTYFAIILPTQFKQVADQSCRDASTTNSIGMQGLLFYSPVSACA